MTRVTAMNAQITVFHVLFSLLRMTPEEHVPSARLDTLSLKDNVKYCPTSVSPSNNPHHNGNRPAFYSMANAPWPLNLLKPTN
jgi:hypothetical protein